MFTRFLSRLVVLMAIVLPMLRITDGITTVNMLTNGKSGYHLLGIAPVYPEVKDGGLFQSNPWTDGRQPILRLWESVTDTISLVIDGKDQNTIIAYQHRLESLLMKAIGYWTSSRGTEPVWIEERGGTETGARYALIQDWRAGGVNDPYQSPFTGRRISATNFQLTLDHTLWQGQPPNTGACVLINGKKDWDPSLSIGVSRTIVAGTDDVYYQYLPQVWFPANAYIKIGDIDLPAGNGPFDAGLRFTNITVPAGSRIVRAYLDVEGVGGAPAIPEVLIRGELAVNPATFGTLSNFLSRIQTPTQASAAWKVWDTWGAGVHVRSLDISDIVQELVDQPTWASGNAMALFLLHTGGRAMANNYRAFNAFDSGAGDYAYLKIFYAPISYLGQTDTCDQGSVYIANKDNSANLTHIYTYAAVGPVWGANLMGSALPYGLLPNPPAAGDMVYFGSRTSVPGSGPFNNLVFDIGTAAFNLTTVTWQYYNGAWVTLGVTDNTALTHSWEQLLINSIHWAQPSDWTSCNLQTLFGGAAPNLAAYYVRAVVGAVGGAPVRPIQTTRQPYSIVRGSVSIPAASVTGTAPALAKALLRIESDKWNVWAGIATPVSRVIAGLRTQEQDDRFTAYINFADEQNPLGVGADPDGVYTTEVAASKAPAGVCFQYAPTGATALNVWATEARIRFDQIANPQFNGIYHAFMRCYQDAGSSGDFEVRLLSLSAGFTVNIATLTAIPVATTDWYVADFGRIDVPPIGDLGVDQTDLTGFDIQIKTAAITGDLYMYDLILIPVDEWAADMLTSDTDWADIETELLENNESLVIDSVGNQKAALRAYFIDNRWNQITARLQTVNNGPAILHPNTDQKMWFFSMNRDAANHWVAKPEIAYSVNMEAIRRYLLFRGTA